MKRLADSQSGHFMVTNLRTWKAESHGYCFFLIISDFGPRNYLANLMHTGNGELWFNKAESLLTRQRFIVQNYLRLDSGHLFLCLEIAKAYFHSFLIPVNVSPLAHPWKRVTLI